MQDKTVVDPGFGGPSVDATQVVPAAGAGYEATQQALTTSCPVCGTPNPPSERYCQDCGLLFESVQGEVEQLPDMSELPRLTDASGHEYVLNPGENLVGRDSADVLLADPTVSRRHALLRLDGEQVTVEDLGSTNGTFVAGARITAGQSLAARNGEAVRFGHVELRIVLPGAPVAAPREAPEPVVEDRGEPRARLRLADGGEHLLYVGINTIGRRSSNQIVIADAFMSGRHAELHCDESGELRLVDVGSTNGTFVDGERLAPNTPVELADGAAFRLGRTEASVEFLAAAAPEDQAATDAADDEELEVDDPAREAAPADDGD